MPRRARLRWARSQRVGGGNEMDRENSMRAIGLVLLSIAIMALLLTDADAKRRRSSAQGSQAAGASRSWCDLWKEGHQRQLQLCHATTVSGPGVGARWLLPTESVSRDGVWDGIYLVVRSAALEPRAGTL